MTVYVCQARIGQPCQQFHLIFFCLLDSLGACSVFCTDLSVADCVHGTLDV